MEMQNDGRSDGECGVLSSVGCGVVYMVCSVVTSCAERCAGILV